MFNMENKALRYKIDVYKNDEYAFSFGVGVTKNNLHYNLEERVQSLIEKFKSDINKILSNDISEKK